jgi:hypothetical protein
MLDVKIKIDAIRFHFERIPAHRRSQGWCGIMAPKPFRSRIIAARVTDRWAWLSSPRL